MHNAKADHCGLSRIWSSQLLHKDLYMFLACSDEIMRGRRGVVSKRGQSFVTKQLTLYPFVCQRIFKSSTFATNKGTISGGTFLAKGLPLTESGTEGRAPTHKAGEKFCYKLLQKKPPPLWSIAPLYAVSGLTFTASYKHIMFYIYAVILIGSLGLLTYSFLILYMSMTWE